MMHQPSNWASKMTSEPNDVRVKGLENRWVVKIEEHGKLMQHFLNTKRMLRSSQNTKGKDWACLEYPLFDPTDFSPWEES
jgi:hypothetical protein